MLSSCFTYGGTGQAKTSNKWSHLLCVPSAWQGRFRAREETPWQLLYRRRYPQAPMSSSSSVICQLAVAPRTYPNRQQSSQECSSNNPHAPYIASEIQVTNKLQTQPTCPRRTRFCSQDKLFLPSTNWHQKHQYFLSWTRTAVNLDFLEEPGFLLGA